MHEKHLDHLLEAVAVLQKNTWGEGYTEGIHNNWIRAARNSGRKFEIERKNNHPYIKFFRKDSSYIGEIDPWKLPDLTPFGWTPDIQPGWVGKKGNLPPCPGTPNSSNVMLWPSMKTMRTSR